MTLHFPVEVNLNSPDSLNRFISRSNPKHSFLEKKVFEKYWIMFDLWSWNAPLIAHKSNSTQQNNRVAKSDLNSTDAYFATKNQHQKMAKKWPKITKIAQKWPKMAQIGP